MASKPKEKPCCFLLFLLSLCLLITTAVSPSPPPSPSGARSKPSSKSLAFVRNACRATRYQSLCYRSLSPFAEKINQDQQKLVIVSLTTSLVRARSTALYVSRLKKSSKQRREYMAVKDCMDTMRDSVGEISKSIWELSHMSRANRQEFSWHMSNVETWVSAALTDAGTCFDGFSNGVEGRVKDAVRTRVTNVAQVTSNALALVNRFSNRNN